MKVLVEGGLVYITGKRKYSKNKLQQTQRYRVRPSLPSISLCFNFIKIVFNSCTTFCKR